MDTVKVAKHQLLNIIKKNRDNHRAIYEEAFEGYRTECIRILEENLNNLKSGKRVVVSFFEQAPQDHTNDYNLAIRMLEMSVDIEIDLDTREFMNYVDDNWSWKQQWVGSNAKYSNTLSNLS